MDISKLPRMSKTDTPHNDPGPADPPPPGGAGFPVGPAAPHGNPEAPVPFVTASAWCPNCGAPLAPASKFCNACGAKLQVTGSTRMSPGVGSEVWLSLVIGVVMMLLGHSFAGYALATLRGKPYDTGVSWVEGEKAGQLVGYWELSGFSGLTDCGIFLFGLSLVLEAAVLAVAFGTFRRKTPLVGVALLLTVVATAFNLYVVAKLFSVGVMPIISLLAVGFGGYIAFYEWTVLRDLSGDARQPVGAGR